MLTLPYTSYQTISLNIFEAAHVLGLILIFELYRMLHHVVGNVLYKIKPNLLRGRDGKLRVSTDSRAALGKGGSAFCFSEQVVLLF